MKAIVCTKYGPPEVLQLQEVEKPAPKDNEVLIRIYATAVTSSDCLIRGSKVPLRLWLPMRLVIGLTKPRNPIPRMGFAGEVEAVGTEVTRFHKGNQVYALNITRFGTYAQYTCLPENSVMVFKPSTLTYEEAAAVPFGGLLALHFLRKGEIQSAQKVLIYGASGAVGTSAVQLARLCWLLGPSVLEKRDKIRKQPGCAGSLAYPFEENDSFFERMCQGASTGSLCAQGILNSLYDIGRQILSVEYIEAK